MKKLLLVFLAGLLAMAADAQTSCNASMTWTQATNSYNVTFTNTSTVNPAMPPSAFAGTSRFVIIGGQYYNATTPYTHSFSGPGSYPVIAYVSYIDSIGTVGLSCNDTTMYMVTVTQQPCAVSITSVTGSGLARTFTANGGSPATGTTYTWNFGDGSAAATGVSTSHAYAAAGTYTVTVTATGGGCTSTASTVVTIANGLVLNCATVSNSFSVSGTGSTRTFFPSTTPINFPRTNNWNFGNGSTATNTGSGSVSSSYPLAGTYTVCLITTWTDSANNITCTDTACQSITITTGGGTSFNCATASSSFTASGQGSYQWFMPSISPANATGVTVSNNWNFGDGTSSSNSGTAGIGHTYPSSGTYNVCLITRWLQSGTTNILCADTSCQSIAVTAPNVIYGYVSVDSLPGQPVDTFKVWLIGYNAATSMLTAIDSLTISGSGGQGFQFSNKPAGVYRTKAHKLNQAAGAFGYVPTYRDSSLTWSGAQTFMHTNGTSYSGAIYMRHGLVTSGPGFVGGSVLMGANKGTADGDPVINQLVFLRNAATGSLVQSTYTNGAGQYSFSNIPLGSYTVYPEEMNYATTPSAILTLSPGAASVNNMLFKKDDVDMDIKPASATGIGAAVVNALEFTVMPNPTSGKISLAIPGTAARETDLRITSMTGQVVYASRMSAVGAASLDLSHLQGGIYFVTVSTDAGVGTAKLVITR